jgi:hypothetical protein
MKYLLLNAKYLLLNAKYLLQNMKIRCPASFCHMNYVFYFPHLGTQRLSGRATACHSVEVEKSSTGWKIMPHRLAPALPAPTRAALSSLCSSRIASPGRACLWCPLSWIEGLASSLLGWHSCHCPLGGAAVNKDSEKCENLQSMQ